MTKHPILSLSPTSAETSRNHAAFFTNKTDLCLVFVFLLERQFNQSVKVETRSQQTDNATKMTVRPASRVLAFTVVAVVLILAVSFFRPASPLSPEVRAPGHLPATNSKSDWKLTGTGTGTGTGYEGKVGGGGGGVNVSKEVLDGEVVMPRLGNETAKSVHSRASTSRSLPTIFYFIFVLNADGTCRAELGRSSWRLLHTMMARFPDEPSAEQQDALRSFVYLFGRLYPWYEPPILTTLSTGWLTLLLHGGSGECASHFQSYLSRFPPQVSSRSSAAGWACHVHNEVNKMLDKEIFDCSKIGDFYDCGCDHGDEGTEKGKNTPPSGDGKEKGAEEEEAVLGPGKVEINDEP